MTSTDTRGEQLDALNREALRRAGRGLQDMGALRERALDSLIATLRANAEQVYGAAPAAAGRRAGK